MLIMATEHGVRRRLPLSDQTILVFCEGPLFQNRASSKVNLKWKENDNHSDDKVVRRQSVTTANDTNDNEDQKERGHILTSRHDLRKQYIKVPKKFED